MSFVRRLIEEWLDNNNIAGTGVRINCISPGQIDVGVDLKGV